MDTFYKSKQFFLFAFTFLKVNFIVSESERENIIVEDSRLLIKARCSFLVIKYEKCVIEMTTNKREKKNTNKEKAYFNLFL